MARTLIFCQARVVRSLSNQQGNLLLLLSIFWGTKLARAFNNTSLKRLTTAASTSRLLKELNQLLKYLKNNLSFL